MDLLAKIADDNIKDGIFKIANVQQQSSVDDATRLGRQGYLLALKVCTSQEGRSLTTTVMVTKAAILMGT